MQQYDQRRLRLFAVVLFLGIMAANLGRYLIFDGLYLWDARLRWQECAYVLHGLNPFDVMHSRVPSIESIGWLDASLGGTVPWAYVLGNVINPGFLPYSAMCVYILALDFIAPLVTALCMGRFLLRQRYVQDKYMAVLASLLVFAPSMWANAVLFGNQSGIVCCCVILSMCVLEDSETLAGLLLAVAMCKPQVAFVFLFPLLCKKRWKAITVTSGTVLGSWLLAAILTESSPISMLTDIMDQGLSYNTSYYGLFNFLLGFGISTKVVLLLDVAVGGVILLAAAAWMFRKKLANAVLFGNQSGIVCCCVILSMCVLEDSETLAGLLLAVAMCKPQVAFVFLFPLLCKKRWKAITVTSGTVLGSWLLAAILTESSPISMLTDIMDQGLSYNTSYYGLFNFLLGFGISTKVVLLLDVAVGGVILLAAAAWMFRKKLDNDWLLWYAVTAVVSVMWFYKQSHDYIILALPAIAIFCLPHISLPAWGSILILLVDVIAFAVPKVCTLLCGLPKDVVSPWAKLLETVAIMATLYYVFQSAKRHAAALQQASQNG